MSLLSSEFVLTDQNLSQDVLVRFVGENFDDRDAERLQDGDSFSVSVSPDGWTSPLKTKVDS